MKSIRRSPAFLESLLALVAVLSESLAESQLPQVQPAQGLTSNGGHFDSDGWDEGRSTLVVDASLARSNPLLSSTNSAENETSFCDSSMTMSMFMDGFHSSLVPTPFDANTSSSSSTTPPEARSLLSCLAYLSPSLELSSRSRFAWAMLATFLLAVTLEALSALRCRIHCGGHPAGKNQGVGTRIQRSRNSNSNGMSSGSDSGWQSSLPRQTSPRTRHLLLTAIYACQAVLGYIIMLITMAYSVELLASVIAGLMAGNLLFMTVVASDCYERNLQSYEQQRRRFRRDLSPSEEGVSSLSPLLQPLLQPSHHGSLVV